MLTDSPTTMLDETVSFPARTEFPELDKLHTELLLKESLTLTKPPIKAQPCVEITDPKFAAPVTDIALPNADGEEIEELENARIRPRIDRFPKYNAFNFPPTDRPDPIKEPRDTERSPPTCRSE
jgi:hypothetical protein